MKASNSEGSFGQNRFLLRFLWLLAIASPATVSAQTTNDVAKASLEKGAVVDTNSVPLGESSETPANLRPFQLVLPREHLLGDWFGLRTKLEDFGISPTIIYVTDIAGNPIGGKRQGITYADNLGLDVNFDLEKLVNLPGGSFLASMSLRGGNSLSHDFIGNAFTVQQVYGGSTFKVIDLAYRQKLFSDRVEFRVGRIAAGDDFLVSPYNWLFMQNGFDGNPVGIFFNSPGMTAYPNAAWGALLKVRPTQRTYLMAAIYNGDPAIRENYHHGVDMSMNGPLFAIFEAGYRRNGLPGDDGLLGNYKAGFWYDNGIFTDYRTTGYDTAPETQHGNWGVYALADQVLFAFGERSRNSGFGICGSVLASPDESVSEMPYFFTAGIVARGFLESRPRDIAGFGIVYGHFSDDLRAAQEREAVLDTAILPQDSEAVLEWTYRFSFGKGAILFQPDLQYIIQPGGTSKVDNALVLGCQIGFNF